MVRPCFITQAAIAFSSEVKPLLIPNESIGQEKSKWSLDIEQNALDLLKKLRGVAEVGEIA